MAELDLQATKLLNGANSSNMQIDLSTIIASIKNEDFEKIKQTMVT